MENQLEFICPECGGNHLECVQDGIHFSEITALDDDGDFEYGPIESCGDVLRFQCLDCGYVIKDNYGNEIVDNIELIDWINGDSEEEED